MAFCYSRTVRELEDDVIGSAVSPFKQPVFTCANTHKRTPIEIHKQSCPSLTPECALQTRRCHRLVRSNHLVCFAIKEHPVGYRLLRCTLFGFKLRLVTSEYGSLTAERRGLSHDVSVFLIHVTSQEKNIFHLYRCTVHFVVYLSNTPTKAHIQSLII